MRSILNSSESLKSHCDSNNWPIWTQKVPKEASRCRLQTFIKVFQRYSVVHEQSAVENWFSTYVCYAPDGLFWLNLYVRLLLRQFKVWIHKRGFQRVLVLIMLMYWGGSKLLIYPVHRYGSTTFFDREQHSKVLKEALLLLLFLLLASKHCSKTNKKCF